MAVYILGFVILEATHGLHTLSGFTCSSSDMQKLVIQHEMGLLRISFLHIRIMALESKLVVKTRDGQKVGIQVIRCQQLPIVGRCLPSVV